MLPHAPFGGSVRGQMGRTQPDIQGTALDRVGIHCLIICRDNNRINLI